MQTSGRWRTSATCLRKLTCPSPVSNNKSRSRPLTCHMLQRKNGLIHGSWISVIPSAMRMVSYHSSSSAMASRLKWSSRPQQNEIRWLAIKIDILPWLHELVRAGAQDQRHRWHALADGGNAFEAALKNHIAHLRTPKMEPHIACALQFQIFRSNRKMNFLSRRGIAMNGQTAKRCVDGQSLLAYRYDLAAENCALAHEARTESGARV